VNRFSLTHLSNEVLDRELPIKAARRKSATAEELAYIAEFDERKRFLPAAYESMLAYCVGELGLSRDEAKQRIHIARAGRTCPGVFEALEQGRIHLTGLRLLAPHLTPENADDLLAAAAHKSKEEIEELLAARAPRMDVPAMVASVVEGAPEHAGNTDSQGVTAAQTAAARSCDRITPLSAESYAVQFTRSREADERFRYAQTLLGSRVKSTDLAEVYGRAIEALIQKLEKVGFGACANPRKGRRTRSGSRHVSNDVKRAVWIRDQGQCTYKSASGRRCEARRDLQFDHKKEFARGGEATVDNIRLRCPGHNQRGAEETYGAGFMKQKREQAAAARAKKRLRDSGAPPPEPPAGTDVHDVYLALCTLGYSDGESRRASALCAENASREDKLRQALKYFPQRGRTVAPFANGPTVSGSPPPDSAP